jgi:hypothetical protein
MNDAEEDIKNQLCNELVHLPSVSSLNSKRLKR